MTEAFLGACESSVAQAWERVAAAEPAAFGARLRAIIEHARSRWPGVDVDDEAFATWLGARVGEPRDGAATLEALCTDDLYLACASDRQDPVAIALVCGEGFADVDAALRTYGLSPPEIDDVRQQVLEACVVARVDRTSGLSRYRGVGALRRWLRTVAVRRAALLRGKPATRMLGDDDLLDAVAQVQTDPDLAVARERYRDQIAGAFTDAMASLTPRERNLLRQYYLDGLGIDALALMYGIHRSTAARWVAAARSALGDGTIARLRTRVGAEGVAANASEFASLMRMVHSQVDFSVRRLLLDP